jgi:DNA replication protein DnaC
MGKCERHGAFAIQAVEMLGVKLRRSMCPTCIAEDHAAEAARKLQEQAEAAKRRWEAKIGQAGIPERFRDRSLDAYVATADGQKRALAFARSYADGFCEPANAGKSALFLGLPGTGKTHLAIGVALQIMAEGKTAMFATVMRAIRTIKDTWRKGADTSEAEAIKALVFPDLLILDEIGIQFGSDAEKLLLFDVLNERYERRRPTILLSNLTAKEVSGYLGERIMDRLREDGGEVIVFDWESHRGRA